MGGRKMNESKTVLIDLAAKWRERAPSLDPLHRNGMRRLVEKMADELESELTPFVQELGAKIMEQSEAARIHGQYEVCIALKTAIETMENALLGPEKCERGCGKQRHEGQACGW
jgi:hypothetical protein